MFEVFTAVQRFMQELAIPCENEEWSGENTYPYWVCKYLGAYHPDESGRLEHYPILEGHDIAEDDSWLALMTQSERIARALRIPWVTVLPDGTAVELQLENITSYPSQIPSHKNIQISLRVITWTGGN